MKRTCVLAILILTLVGCSVEKHTFNEGLPKQAMTSDDSYYETFVLKTTPEWSCPYREYGRIEVIKVGNIITPTFTIKVYNRQGRLILRRETTVYDGFELKRHGQTS